MTSEPKGGEWGVGWLSNDTDNLYLTQLDWELAG